VKTVVYGPAPGAPEGHVFVAHIFYVENLPKKGAVNMALPVMIFGETYEQTFARSEAHIAEYLEKARRQMEPRVRKPKAAPTETLEDII